MRKFFDFMKKGGFKIISGCILLVLIIIISFNAGRNLGDFLFKDSSEPKDITYLEFLDMLEHGDVDIVYYSTNEEEMTAYCFNDETKDMPLSELKEYEYPVEEGFSVTYPAHDEFRKELLEKGVRVEVLEEQGLLVTILSSLLSLALPILWLVLIFKVLGKQMGMGTGLDTKTLIQKSDVKFDNIIGHEEILDDIKFITKLIKKPEVGEVVGAKVPKGILLSGEPGTGKTLIAKAIAGEADVPFLYVNASSLIEMFVGVGAKRVREVFKIAKENAPCIIFIDEIDSVGSNRDSKSSNREYEQTINALLQEMDGFSGREGIFVIAATNRPDTLDKALTRAGRFDRQITVNRPRDWRVRKELFTYYLSKFAVSDDVDIDNLSKQVSGFTGADIASICNEASIIAVMHDKKFIDNSCIEEAIDKKVFKGNRSKKEHFKDDKIIVAYHEAGHAVCTYLTNQPIARASIIGTTSGVGGAVFGADTESYFLTDKELRANIMIAYAGRASEEIKFSNITTGASSDLNSATKSLVNYIEHYGFDKEFGLLDMSVIRESNYWDGKETVKRVSEMSKKLYEETLNLLNTNYKMVELVAQKLLECETLSGEEIEELIKGQ